MQSQNDKGKVFKALHVVENDILNSSNVRRSAATFVLPNFWDVGSAKLLESMGFKALASTSAGFAQSIGKLDSQISLEEKLTHLASVAAATDVPISADFEHGFADSPEQAAANLIRAAHTGIVGASIEDWSRTEIYPQTLAVERIQACAEAVAKLDFEFTLTARAENLLRGVQDMDDTISRLQAYAKAGADVLYAPGLASAEQIEQVVSAVDKPINVLCAFMPNMAVSEYAALNVSRISLGSGLANHAIGASIAAAQSMQDEGNFSWLLQAAGGKQIAQIMNDQRTK